MTADHKTPFYLVEHAAMNELFVFLVVLPRSIGELRYQQLFSVKRILR